jgi:hypothetical protein
MGGLSEEDLTTGISFTPTGEAYHMARWLGIFLIAPLLWSRSLVLISRDRSRLRFAGLRPSAAWLGAPGLFHRRASANNHPAAIHWNEHE